MLIAMKTIEEIAVLMRYGLIIDVAMALKKVIFQLNCDPHINKSSKIHFHLNVADATATKRKQYY
jgi:hypothetical protein